MGRKLWALEWIIGKILSIINYQAIQDSQNAEVTFNPRWISIHNEAIVECVRVSLPSTWVCLCSLYCRLWAQPAEFMSCPGSSVVEHSSREQSAVGLSPTKVSEVTCLSLNPVWVLSYHIWPRGNLVTLNSSEIAICSLGLWQHPMWKASHNACVVCVCVCVCVCVWASKTVRSIAICLAG